MKKKIKLSDFHQEEMKKDEMHVLVGGEGHAPCRLVCSCSCACQSTGDSVSDQNSQKESTRNYPGWLMRKVNNYGLLIPDSVIIEMYK